MRIGSTRDLANTIRARRAAAGLTQTDLAAASGVSRQWLSALEHGKPTAELGLVLAVLDALNIQMELTERPPTAAGEIDLDTLLAEHRRP